MAITDTIKEIFTGTEVHSLKGLFTDMLRDVYDAEQQIYEALPTMRENATSTALQQAFDSHRDETRTHIERLEKVFKMLDLDVEGKSCEAIEGLIAEAQEAIDSADETVIDAALIAAGQAIEHYEMARYGTLHAWAEELNMPQAAALLEKTLSEEKTADQKLNKLALGGINRSAALQSSPASTSAGKSSSRTA